MRACMSLANICQAKDVYAIQLFEKGLMKIMLKIVKSKTVEIHRQVRISIYFYIKVLSKLHICISCL